MTLVIGLTGGIATGKSTVAKLLHQAGWPVIDADQVAREVVEPGTVGLAKLQQAFGTQIITAGGTLDRAKLSQIIFQAAEQRQRLNTILHPLIEQAVDQQLSQFQRLQTPVVVLDVPLLYESGWDKKMWSSLGRSDGWNNAITAVNGAKSFATRGSASAN